MDAKDLRTESTIGERSSNGSSKFAQGGAAPSCITSKTYENMSANPLAKLEAPTSRPCAVIGPDRIVPPSNSDAYSKKSHYEPWPHENNTYRQPPEYPHKIPSYQSPIRNISPRQTFQENMQRIMVQPTYNSVKLSDDPNYTLDRNANKNSKFTGPHETKYCDVPYSVNPISSDQKPNEMCVTNMNSSRNYPQVWHPAGVGIRPTRPYGAPEMYQFAEYSSCAGPRPMPMPRPHRAVNEDSSHAYNETYYPEGNIRFKPYPTVKERYPQARYEYMSNYATPFHPPPFPPHKYDLQKPLPPHVTYPQIPMKYLENRMTDTIMDGYQRPQPVNYNVPYRNQVIHPTYGPMIGSNLQNKVYPYPPDGPVKSLAPNKLPYDSKLYADYENARNKGYSSPENMYLNEIVRPHIKNQPILPSYPAANMQTTHVHPYYRKDGLGTRSYEYLSHLRHLDPSMNPNALTRLSTQFSPNSVAISPSDSNTSNETSHTHGGSLEDCGYVSQSSTTSIRSYDSGINRIMPNDFYQRYNYPYQTMVRTSPLSSKPDGNGTTISSKDNKSIDVRQFLQMWNEGEEESGGKEKEVVNQSDFNSSKLANQYGAMKNNEQLYVLGLVNVPSEELGKYEHIQKISKLPENIKGYNNIELLKQFEQAIESSNISNLNHKPPSLRNYPSSSMRSSLVQGTGLIPPRPISPLDVEAKISQSVIHKEVGCNFEIKPCSPEMLNAEVATTAQNVLGEERVIEKVSNPIIIKSPMLSSNPENEKQCDTINQKEHRIMLKEDSNKTASCKMIHTQCSNSEGVNEPKSNYSLQDLESNAGVCLASLPRLDNDIELNFPEVNQQFINANKESVIIANDFTTELEPLPNTDHYKSDGDIISKIESTSSVLPILDLEKEVTKLSKYRKIKRNDVEYKENQPLSVSQSLRTDSVIIKNPENPKTLEKKLKTSSIVKETNQLVYHDVLNSDPVCSPANNQSTKNINNEDANEMAIDFSLSRVERNMFEMYSTRDLKSPKKTPADQTLSKDTNDICVPSDNNNDITLKVPTSDEINDINLYPVSENVTKCNIELENNDVDITQHNVLECSKNLPEILSDTVNKEAESCNIANESTAEEMEDEATHKIITPTKEILKMDTPLSASSIDINKQDEEDTILLIDKISVLNKVSEHSRDTNTNIQNVESTQSLEAVYNNNIYDRKYSKSCSFVKNYTLSKELFSPQIQNLLLWSEGYSGLCSSLRNNKNSHSVTDSHLDISTINNINDLNNSNVQIQLNNVRNCDSKICIMAVDNLINNSPPSESTDFNDCGDSDSDSELISVGNNVEECIKDKLQSEPTNAKSYADSVAEVSAFHKSVQDVANDGLQLKSTNVKDHPISVSNIEDSSVEEFMNVDFQSSRHITDSDGKPVYNGTHFTNNELQSEFTNRKDCPVSSSDVESSTVNDSNSIEKFANSELKSQLDTLKMKSVFESDLNSFVDNSLNVRELTNNKLTLETTDSPILKSIDGVSSVDILNTGKFCVNSELQSETIVKDGKISKSNAKRLGLGNPNSVIDCADGKIQSETTDIMDDHVSASGVDTLGKESLNNDKYSVYSELTSKTVIEKVSEISDLNEKLSDADNLISVIDFENSKLQSETKITDCSVSHVDTYTEFMSSDSSKVQSTIIINKGCDIFDSNEKLSVVDNLNSVIDFASNKLQSATTDITISGSDVDTSTVNNLNSISADIKDGSVSDSDVKICAIEELDVFKNVTSSELRLESTNHKDCLVSDPIVDTDVQSLNFTKDFPKNELESKSSDYKETNCQIIEDKIEADNIQHKLYSSNDSLDDTVAHFNQYTKHSEKTTDDDLVSDPIVDSDVKSLNFTNDFPNNELESKSSDYKESSCQIIEDKIEAENIQHKLYSSNDSLDDTVAHLNQYITHSEKTTDDDFYEGETVAEDSGVHDIGKDSRIFEETVTDTNDTIVHEASVCIDQTLGKELDQIMAVNEDPGVVMPSKEPLVRRGLKRSLSDSALVFYDSEKEENFQYHNLMTKKRHKKNNYLLNTCEPDFSTTEMLNIHNIRRNSISSIYNEENMSFCIVIDNNCIITEENEEGDKICYTEIPEECLTGIHTDHIDEDEVEAASEIIVCPSEITTEPLVLEISDEKSLEESWVDDVACVETVVSDDIAEDIELSDPSSPIEMDDQQNEESEVFNIVSEHTEKVKYIYGDKMCNDDAELVETLYRTPQMDVNKTLIHRESHVTNDDDEFYEGNPINNIHPEPHKKTLVHISENYSDSESKPIEYNKTSNEETEVLDKPIYLLKSEHDIPTVESIQIKTDKLSTTSCEVSQNNTANSSESSVDSVFAYNQDESSANCSVFSSPEVSSTTSEEKNTSLLLKITNYQGTRTSKLNELNSNKMNSCKFTENVNYTHFIGNLSEPRPLITKAAQKYIPPIKEPVDNLKVKLSLPRDSLMKFKQLKLEKNRVRHNAVPKKDIPKKPKPKFEDVLKSLDEIQYKMHKEKRKPKKTIPKVVIKKTENGSHYASTPNRDGFNPDLTGRKWQPWVFIEKSNFIDKMALRRKTKAIYNHRKNTYVFADKFKKYKSMPSAKFVISQPKLDDPSVGKLKYTIRLKHSY